MTVTDNDPGTTARDGNGKAAKGEYFLHRCIDTLPMR